METMHERIHEVARLTQRLQKEFPGETKAFLELLNKAERGAALSLKDKELINTALAVAAQCEWCIVFYVQNVVKAGANPREIVEVGFQSVVMHGGPAFMWITHLLNAIDEFVPTNESV